MASSAIINPSGEKRVFPASACFFCNSKTAIRRPSFSRPVACLLRDRLIDSSKTLFDYGCEHGQDLQLLSELNIQCDGWDPMFRPAAEKQRADVVNIGYVINVIEHVHERSAAL